eukprot:366131-Chlamydomonas_euryale.AAC.2
MPHGTTVVADEGVGTSCSCFWTQAGWQDVKGHCKAAYRNVCVTVAASQAVKGSVIESLWLVLQRSAQTH